MPPTTSIVLPTYNGSRFLRPQLDSILAQSASDFELLVIDDGSSDDTVAIVDDYATRDDRIRRLPSSGSSGQKIRLRQLMAAAVGRFIAVADQDDIWDVERNRLFLDAIGDKAMAFGRSQLVDEAGRDLGRSLLDENDVDPESAGILNTLFRPLVSGHASLIRREWLDLATLYGPSPFDWMLGLEALLSSGLVYEDRAVVRHRIHGGNQSNREAADALTGGSVFATLHKSWKMERPDRMSFYIGIDQLSRSMVIDQQTRGRLHRAATACRYAWFHGRGLRPGRTAELKRALFHHLDPLASSAEDREAFHRYVTAMVRGPLAPRRLVSSVIARLAGRV